MKKIINCTILIAVCIILSACGKEKKEFSEKGKIAVNKVKELQSYMKAPDTFELKDDVLVIEQDNEYKNIFVYILYTAENSYGVPLQDMGVFRNEEYCGSFYEMNGDKTAVEDLVKNSSSWGDYTDSVVKKLKEEDVLKLYSDWENGKIKKCEIISRKDIGEELGIKYK